MDSRQTLRYNEDGHVVFVSGTMGIVFNRHTVHQTFYQGHVHPLISLDVNSKGRIAASGELHVDGDPEIHIWDAKTCRAIATLKGVHSQGVTCLSFSPSGDCLVSLGQDSLHSLAIHYSPSNTWTDGHLVCSVSVSPHKMLWCSFVEGNEYPIAVGGAGGDKSGVFFFRVVRGNAERLRGTFGKKFKIQPVLCAVAALTVGKPPLPSVAAADAASGMTAVSAVNSNKLLMPSLAASSSSSVGSERALICGTVSGYLYAFFNYKVVARISAHETSIYAISSSNGGLYITAGKDGKVKLWRDDFQLMHTFKTPLFVPRPYGVPVHSVVLDNKGGRTALVGMRSGEVYEIALQNQSHFLLLETHADLELHAGSPNPMDPDQYATAGDDGIVRVWSLAKKYCLRRLDLECASRAVCWSPDGTVIVVGIGRGGVATTTVNEDGAFIVLDSQSLEIVKEERKSKQFITYIYFSPNEQMLALGSDDGRVYLHDVIDYRLLSVVETGIRITSAEAAAGLKCAVTTFDFSADSKYLRVATSTQDLVYYQIETAVVVSHNPAVAFADTKWASHHVPYSWTAQG